MPTSSSSPPPRTTQLTATDVLTLIRQSSAPALTNCAPVSQFLAPGSLSIIPVAHLNFHQHLLPPTFTFSCCQCQIPRKFQPKNNNYASLRFRFLVLVRSKETEQITDKEPVKQITDYCSILLIVLTA